MTVSRDVVRGRTAVFSVKKSYAKIGHILDLPNLIHIQLESYRAFQRHGMRELLDEISPIQDFTGTRLQLRFGDYSFGEPKYSER
jgi:DNA-directed RNA polymerase subunit beta